MEREGGRQAISSRFPTVIPASGKDGGGLVPLVK